MAKLLSGRVRTFNVGITSSTESQTALSVIGITSTRSLTVTSSATINGLTYPTSDGLFNQVLATDGTGNISFTTVPGLGGSISWESDLDFGLVSQETTITSDLGLITDDVGDDYDLGSLSIPSVDFSIDQDLGNLTSGYSYVNDFGELTNSATSSYDFGILATSGLIYPDQFVLPSFTVSTLPSVTPAGQMLFVTDETGGSIPAFSDGTNWRRISDAQIVS